MRQSRTFRDPVHTNISFDRRNAAEALLLKLLDAPEVQRLRHVRQLGLANLVYHGVEHSRFSHTVGVAHLARRLYQAGVEAEGTAIDQDEYAVVLAAALLHDVGHAPFSHALEKSLGVKHEKISVVIVSGDSQVNTILTTFGGADFVQNVVAHITDSTDRRTVGLISSQLDADRMDYVLRDGYHAGVPNARFDLERIIQKTRLDSTGLIFEQHAQQAIEGYFIARYHLYIQLYYHRAVRSAEAMLRATIARARTLSSDGQSLGEIGEAARLFESTPSLEIAARLTDHELWAAFRHWATAHPDRVLRDLSTRLLNRRLFKSIEVPGNAFEFTASTLPQINDLARNAGFDPDSYVLRDTAKDTPYKLSDPASEPSGIKATRLKLTDGKTSSLEMQSGVVQALQKEAYQMNRICFPEEIRDEVIELVG